MLPRPLMLLLLLLPIYALAADPPPLPVGLDAYRQWDHWPYQRTGERAYMRSTYDRSGGNEGADASHFLFEDHGRHVTLDLENPGILYFVRTNHWHGSPWHYVVDGHDHIVQETSTSDPLHPAQNSTFIPPDLFPSPLAFTWATTKGADLNWRPMPFTHSLRLAYSRTCYGTGYYIYHQFIPGTALSQPLESWKPQPPDQDVLDLLSKSGQDIAPPGDESRSDGKPILLSTTTPRAIRAVQITAPRASALDLARIRLKITWDGRNEPSVDAPLPLFFGTGTLYNRENQEYLVKAFPINIRFDNQLIHLACYFPMPFFRSAKVELVNATPGLTLTVRSVPIDAQPNELSYFHATYKDHPTPEPGHDLLLLDTRNLEGSEHWTGSFVGTSFIFSHNAFLGTLEGDPRFFFDDSNTPQAQGTGTEEWGGGGDYWGGRNMTLPLAGHPVGAKDAKSAKSEVDKIESAYRFLLADLFPFGNNAKITLEHGGTDESKEHYETVTYWYGLPGQSLVLTDTLQIADENSEKAHTYTSPTASAPIEITSRYELGVDHIGNKEIFPAQTDKGRTMTGTSEFILAIDPANLGVLLRRKLDYAFPNQRAQVFIADASLAGKTGFEDADFKPAGTWYLAGSNTCYYSRPNGELDGPKFDLRVSNRRFRDDEFLLPLSLTQNRSRIRVRLVFTPVNRPLFPTHPIPPLAWSEISYRAYSFVVPDFHP
jgi:hypothetical protein